MCRPSATACLIKSPGLEGRGRPALEERLLSLPDPRCRRGGVTRS